MNNFTPESYAAFEEAALEKYDFKQCQRQDGTIYGVKDSSACSQKGAKEVKPNKGGEGGGGASKSSDEGESSSKLKSNDRHAWGGAVAAAAPTLLSLLSAAHVPEQAVDSVSGCALLISRLISSAAEGSDRGEAAGKGADARWVPAAKAARLAIAEVMPRATEGAAAWARGMKNLATSVSGHYAASTVGGVGGGGGGGGEDEEKEK